MLSDRSGQPKLTDSSIRGVTFGERVKIVNPVNLYDCELGDDVFVGPFTEIQAGVRVGDRTRVQSHSFICSLVNIGEDVFIGHGVVFINDKLLAGPARGDVSKWHETEIGNRVSIGSNSTILPVRVADDVVIGAGSVVTKDLIKPGVYAGNPAKWLRAIL
jgi:acetyltransferase-like isoleucine patch superfamily enzyme